MKTISKKEFKKENYFGTGIYNIMFAKNMTGKTYMKPLKMIGHAMMLANVSFEPGARCFWHIHRGTVGGGQIIICTAGEGWYQEEGKKTRSLKKGDIVYITAGVKHWHGAKKDKWFSHLSIEVPGENTENVWLEAVDTKTYEQL